MGRYILKRLLWMIPVMLGIAILIFSIMYICPGDPAASMLGPGATQVQIEAKREEQSEEEKEGYLRRERRTGTFSRRFNVSGIQEDAVSARFQDGILELTLPKVQPEVPVPQKITIE